MQTGTYFQERFNSALKRKLEKMHFAKASVELEGLRPSKEAIPEVKLQAISAARAEAKAKLGRTCSDEERAYVELASRATD